MLRWNNFNKMVKKVVHGWYNTKLGYFLTGTGNQLQHQLPLYNCHHTI